MPDDFLQRSNLIGDRIANGGAQTVSDLGVLLGRLLSQREFRGDRRAVNGPQATHKKSERSGVLDPPRRRISVRAVYGETRPFGRHRSARTG